MPTQPYFNAKGERIPSNTTVIGQNLGWKTPGLMNWQRNLFLSQMCEECLKKLQDPNTIKDIAADAGTLAHRMIEASIKGRTLLFGDATDDQIEKADKGFRNYLEWKRQTHFEPITMEVPVVSEVLQVGTTIDVIGWVAGKRSIVECKTSNSVYEDNLIQVAVQKFCWEENNPDQPIEALHLLKVGKEEATFSHHYWENLDVGLEAFEHLRALHDLKKQLKKLI